MILCTKYNDQIIKTLQIMMFLKKTMMLLLSDWVQQAQLQPYVRQSMGSAFWPWKPVR